MNFTEDISVLTLAPVPESTETYSAVSHLDIHYAVLSKLSERNIEVQKIQFKSNRRGTQVIATYFLESDDSEFGGMLATRNSYDKTHSVAICAGASVYICGNGAVMGEMKFIKRHVGEVGTQLESAIDEQLNKVHEMIHNTRVLKDLLDSKTFDRYVAGAVIGNLYLKGVINTSQMEIIKKELDEPSYNYGVAEDSLWALFNHVTHALKVSSPSRYFESHIETIKFFKLFA